MSNDDSIFSGEHGQDAVIPEDDEDEHQVGGANIESTDQSSEYNNISSNNEQSGHGQDRHDQDQNQQQDQGHVQRQDNRRQGQQQQQQQQDDSHQQQQQQDGSHQQNNREQQHQEAPPDPAAKIFVGGLSFETSEEALRRYFQKYGRVRDAVLIMNKFTGQPRGFGFVTFDDARVVEAVIKDNHTLHGRRIEAKPAVARDEMKPGDHGHGPRGGGPGDGCKIFVGGLSPSVEETDLKQYFGQFGTVTDAVVMYDRNTQRSRGFGFVSWSEKAAVHRCLAQTLHTIHDKPVECKQATPRGQQGGAPHGGGFQNRSGYGGHGYNNRGGYGGGYDDYRGGGGYNNRGGYGGAYNHGGGYARGPGGGYGPPSGDGYNSGGYGGGYGGGRGGGYSGHYNNGGGYGGPYNNGGGYGNHGGYGSRGGYGAPRGSPGRGPVGRGPPPEGVYRDGGRGGPPGGHPMSGDYREADHRGGKYGGRESRPPPERRETARYRPF